MRYANYDFYLSTDYATFIHESVIEKGRFVAQARCIITGFKSSVTHLLWKANEELRVFIKCKTTVAPSEKAQVSTKNLFLSRFVFLKTIFNYREFTSEWRLSST